MIKNNKYIFTLFLLLSFLLVYEARLILKRDIRHVSVDNIRTIAEEIKKEEASINQLNSLIEESEKKIKEYNEKTDIELINSLKQKKGNLESYLGYTSLEGPGVIVIVSDATRELGEKEDANNLLVHDSDINILIDELRNAGAEAIEVNGIRVIYNQTKIVCSGPVVTVNDEKISNPFIIKAIGNRKFLESSMYTPDSYSENLRSYGINVEVNTSVSVKINNYVGDIQKEYMKEYIGGDI